MIGPDYIVIGCVSGKLDTSRGPVLAADLYVSPLWDRRRAYAVKSGKPWGILSALYGLIPPTWAIFSYDQTIPRLSDEERSEVVAKTRAMLVGQLGGKELAWGKTVEVHAGKAYVDLMHEAACGLGVKIMAPMEHKGLGEQLAAYGPVNISPETKTEKSMSKTQTAPAECAELIAHNWAPNNECTNPESVPIQLSKDRKATIFLGCEKAIFPKAESAWFFGYYVEAKAGDEVKKCVAEGSGWASRFMALAAGIEEVRAKLEDHKDKAGVKALEAFVKSLGESPVAAIVERSAPNPVAVLGALPKGRFAELPISAIQQNPDNPRKFFDAIAGRELADSIQAQGLLQPIAVRRMLPDELGENAEISAAVPPERYEIILGERRWRAAQMPPREANGLIAKEGAILPAIECKVYEGVTRAQARAAALVENLQREKMNPIEEAEGFRDLIFSTTPPLTQEQAAEMVGKSRSVVANALRVLDLPEDVVAAIREGKLTLAHGVALARFKAYPKAVAIMAKNAIENGWKASYLEKGVPSSYELSVAELVTHIRQYSDVKPTPAFMKKHAGVYFADGDGGAVCFDPPHWKAYLAEREAEKKEREAEEARAAAEKLQKAEKKGKLTELSQLKHEQFRKLEGTRADISDLLPDKAKAIAKDHDGKKVEIATDVALTERLEAALKREVKKDRRKVMEMDLGPSVRSYLSKLKKVGPREMAILMAEMVTYPGTSLRKYLDADTCKAVGINQPAAFRENDLGFDASAGDDPEDAKTKLPQIVRELRALERLDSVTLFRVIGEQRLEDALEAIVEHGPLTPSAYFLRWMLEKDEFGLLEETDEGKRVLLDRVKAAKWYQSEVIEGKPAAEGEKEDAA